MAEVIAKFGPDDAHLLGILHVADSPQLAAQKPAVLMWNVGIAHRVGPQRHFVELARKLARLNFNVFRFDIGGMGDSEAGTHGRSREEQEIADIRSAMDHLSACHGYTSFVLLGFCSSAAHAHPTALRDERVRGLIMIDGYGFRTAKYTLLHYKNRLLSPANWQSRIARLLNVLRRTEAASASYFADFPPPAKVAHELNTMTDRGVRMLFIYSAGVQNYFNHAGQFWQMLPGLNKATKLINVVYFPEANHLFTYLNQKNEYICLISEWLQQHFTAEAPPQLLLSQG